MYVIKTIWRDKDDNGCYVRLAATEKKAKEIFKEEYQKCIEAFPDVKEDYLILKEKSAYYCYDIDYFETNYFRAEVE